MTLGTKCVVHSSDILVTNYELYLAIRFPFVLFALVMHLINSFDLGKSNRLRLQFVTLDK